jgi:hypothetical protein
MDLKEKKVHVEKIIYNLNLNYTEEDKINIQKLIDTYFRKKKISNSKIELIAGSLLWVFSRINFLFENDINWSQKEIAKKLDVKPKSISNNSSIIMDALNIDIFDKRFARKEIVDNDPRNNFVMTQNGFIVDKDYLKEILLKKTQEKFDEDLNEIKAIMSVISNKQQEKRIMKKMKKKETDEERIIKNKKLDHFFNM